MPSVLFDAIRGREVRQRTCRSYDDIRRSARGRCPYLAEVAWLAGVWTRAGITASGRLSLHSLRHGFASLLIANGLNVVFVSRQLGHANPTIMLGTYAHLFERADHAHAARAALEANHTAMAGAGG
jgi:integrase